jgi:nucleoid DNA-binding protein
MTKKNLVCRIAEETTLTQQQILAVIQKTLDHIAGALAEGDTVELRNFGVFKVKPRQARVGRNPNNPATDVAIPLRNIVKFKPGKEMRNSVTKLAL